MVTFQSGSVLDRTVLKEGPMFLVADRAGDITALNVEGHGLYLEDTRFLSLFDLDISGTRLTLLSATGELNFVSNLQFGNDVVLNQRGEVVAGPHTISIRRNRFLQDGLHERIGFFNYNEHPVELTVRMTFGSDFRDMFEVRGYHRVTQDLRGELLPPVMRDDALVLRYRGRDGIKRRTRISFDPAPASWEIVSGRSRALTRLDMDAEEYADPRTEPTIVPPVAAVSFDVSLSPMAAQSITLHVAPELGTALPAAPAPRPSLEASFRRIQASYEAWETASTRVWSDNEVFDRLMSRALQDLRLLTDEVEGDLVPSAGIPWFAVPFGRDSLITAMQTLMLRPDVARGTLRFLARYQGTRVDDFRDEEPGKILHEVRLGELSRLGAVPHSPYYGSVDSTPLFLVALGETLRWTGDPDFAREMLPHAERALTWIDTYGDLDGDGFLEYQTRSSEGIRNQGWKDSHDSVPHRDGHTAEPPIALAEVQAYVYGARRAMADLLERLGEPDRAREQRARADRLRQEFLRAFPVEDEHGPFWAMALDRDKQPVKTPTTNPGHALWTGMLRGQEADVTVRRLLASDMLSGWGVRTLSSNARAFNPMSYHNGSIWPHDNAIVALGMKRAGDDSAATIVADQVFQAGFRFPGYRLPELYCGFSRDEHYRSIPAQYPVSCSPQAWAAGSAYMLLQALLGLEADAFDHVLRVRPLLPLWLGRVHVRRLRVGGRSVDIDIVREGHRTIVDVIDDGGLRVEAREPNGVLALR